MYTTTLKTHGSLSNINRNQGSFMNENHLKENKIALQLTEYQR